jgi:ABC-type lipoprotein export system ATPase subunit
MIDIQNLRRTYTRPTGEPVHALHDCSLRIQRGEYVAITGSSGSGKSTLMNILGLLDRPSDGRYFFDGRDVSGLSPQEQARFRNQNIGFVFQAFHLLPRTSALENVELPLQYSDRESFVGLGEKALAKVGLSDRMEHTPAELSGGQQQRVAIARALVNQPELILADEPTGNLDAQATREILAIFESLNLAGRTIILVTHDASVAARARRVIRLENGRLVNDSLNPIPSVPLTA